MLELEKPVKLSDLINEFGNEARVADFFGIARSNISYWRTRGADYVPLERQQAYILHKRGVKLKRTIKKTS